MRSFDGMDAAEVEKGRLLEESPVDLPEDGIARRRRGDIKLVKCIQVDTLFHPV
jgi:hypothetical protein